MLLYLEKHQFEIQGLPVEEISITGGAASVIVAEVWVRKLPFHAGWD